MTSMKHTYNASDFLNSRKFVEWRLMSSEELDLYWKQYIRNYPEQKKAIEDAILKFDAVQLKSNQLSQNERLSLFESIEEDVSKVKRRRRRKRLYYSFAASAAVLLLIMLALPYNKQDVLNTHSESIIVKTLPSKNVKFISGGEVVEFDDNATFAVSEKGQVSVTIKDNNRILKPTKNNTVVVPYGRQSTLNLADGTKLWLNAGTEVTFPSEFKGKTREIRINGEVYADVATVENKPFIIHTSKLSIKVHGTEFNVLDYEGEENSEIVLVEGKVEIQLDNKQSEFLEPNDMYLKTKNTSTISKVAVENYVSWRNNILVTNKTPIYDLLKYVGRYYNVEFENLAITSRSKNTCSGKLYLSENFDDTMTSIAILTAIEYTKEGKIIYIQ